MNKKWSYEEQEKEKQVLFESTKINHVLLLCSDIDFFFFFFAMFGLGFEMCLVVAIYRNYFMIIRYF